MQVAVVSMSNLDDLTNNLLAALPKVEASFEAILPAPDAFESLDIAKLVEASDSANRAEIDQAIQRIGSALSQMDLYHGCRLSQILGMMVETTGTLRLLL